jgi:hypothetical protein
LTEKIGGKWNERMRRGNGPCPAHHDTHPSLDITERNGTTLLICRAGCSQDSVINALRAKGLWPERRANGKANGHAAQRRIVATYDYLDAEGVLRFQAVRYDPKDFRQRRPDGKGGWIWNLPLDARHRFVPYKLPELVEAIAQERPILVLEGEQDVQTAAKLGLPATCNAGGAGKWTADHAAYLKGADVVLVRDNDDAGQRHMEDVAASLVGLAERVRLLTLPDLPPKGDLTDWVRAGGTIEQLLALIEKATVIEQPPNRSERRTAQSEARRLISRRLSDVKMRTIEWVWTGRIAVGKHTTFAGEPGISKSTLLYGIAAIVSKGGEWPCGEGASPKGSVIILSAEDGVEDTIKPRVIAAGGDGDRVHVVSATTEEDGSVSSFTLQKDLKLLEEMIAEIGDVALIIIDPISSYLGDRVDGHSNTDVRRVVEPLHEMADRLRVAVVTNGHFSKAGAANKSRASHRFIGSIAFVALPRVAFAVVVDPDDEARRLILHVKNNIHSAMPGLAYRVPQKLAGYTDDDAPMPIYAACVEWETEHVATTADQAIASHEAKLRETANDDRPKRASPARDEAEAFLRSFLADGPKSTKEVNDAARVAGITAKPLREARERLVDSVPKRSADGKVIEGFIWRLKPDNATTGSGD